RVRHPAAIGIQVLGAVNVRAHILVAPGTDEALIPVVVPLIEVILLNRSDLLKFRIRRVPAHDCRTAGTGIFDAAWSVDLGFALTWRYLGTAIIVYANADSAPTDRPIETVWLSVFTLQPG